MTRGVVSQVFVSEVLQLENGHDAVNVLKVPTAYHVRDDIVCCLTPLQKVVLVFELPDIPGVLKDIHDAVLLH